MGGGLLGDVVFLAADPDFAAFEELFFPDGDNLLDAVDGVGASLKRGRAVGGCDGDDEADVADFQSA